MSASYVDCIPAIMIRIAAAARPIQRTICERCRALIRTDEPCPICSELRQRQLAWMRVDRRVPGGPGSRPTGMDWVRIERFLDHRIGWMDLSVVERAEMIRRTARLSLTAAAMQLGTTERTVARQRAAMRKGKAA